MEQEFVEIRCPNYVISRDNKVWSCNSLLCKMTKESVVNIRCRKCKGLVTVRILKNGKVKAKIQP